MTSSLLVFRKWLVETMEQLVSYPVDSINIGLCTSGTIMSKPLIMILINNH